MGAAVEDVHHGSRQGVRAGAAQIAVERHIEAQSRSARGRHRHGQNRVRAQPAFVLRAVEFDHSAVEPALVEDVPVGQGFGDFTVDVLDRLEHAFAQEAVGVAVAQFDGLVLARGCAAGNNGTPHRAVDQEHFRLYRRIAA